MHKAIVAYEHIFKESKNKIPNTVTKLSNFDKQFQKVKS